MSAAEEAVLHQIRRLVAQELDLARPLQPSDRLVADLGLDSLTLTTLAVALEDHYQVILSGEATAGIETVGELAGWVAARLEQAS